MTGERVVLYCVGGPAQRTETWVDLPGLPPPKGPPFSPSTATTKV